MDGEFELLSDSKYRGYVSQVEKVLRNFESTAEWADLISALGKLNKVLQQHAKYEVIPKRGIIGKRLAQCLHPALPSGVHLKALETYSIIFKAIGKQGLTNDLFTYSSGLFPLLGYAAMNVKPTLLSIYEDYYLELKESIKPALNGLLLGLLPGLEEGSEHYDRTNVLLEKFSKAAGPTSFYGCLWECVLISPTSRLPAIMFVVSHYNKKQTMEDQLHMMGTNIDLMVQALCSALQDSSVLVQRNFLDFLLLGFTMNNKQLNQPDMIKLVVAALHTLLRRDMSLNRRLFSWFLGQGTSGIPAPQAVHENQAVAAGVPFFNCFSRDCLIRAVKSILEDFSVSVNDGERAANLVPFRILICMLDKPEIGPAIIEEVMVDIFRCLYRECTEPKNGKTNGKVFDEKSVAELIKTANLLFGALEPNYLWDFIARRFEEVYSKSSKNDNSNHKLSVTELASLVDFLIDHVSLEMYPETQTEYLPDLLLRLTNALTENCMKLNDQEIIFSIELSKKILTKVQPPMMLDQSIQLQAATLDESSTDCDSISPTDSTPDSTTLIQACVTAYQKFYSIFVARRVFPDYSLKEAMGQILRKDEKPGAMPRLRARSSVTNQSRITPVCCEAIEKASQLLVEYSTFPIYCREHKSLLDENHTSDVTFPDWSKALLACCVFSSNFYVLTAAVSTMLDLIGLTSSVIDENTDDRGARSSHGTVSVVIMPSLTPAMLEHLNTSSHFYTIVAERLWNYLDASTPEFHQRAVELLYQLHQMAPSAWTCENVISQSLMSGNMPERVEACQRYSTLWHITRNQKSKSGLGASVRTFDRSMFIMLDTLLEDTDPTRALSLTWLTHALQRGDVGRLLEPILLLLLHPDSARVSIQHVDIHETRRGVHSEKGEEDDVETRIYAISSEGGNVIYHLGADNQGKMKIDSPEVRSLSVMNIGRKTKSATHLVAGETDLPFERVDPSNLKLHVNPFGSETSLDKIEFQGKDPEFPNVEKVRRLDRETCRKEGISFDDEDSLDETEYEILSNDETDADVVTQILEEVLLQVFTQIEENEAIELQVSLHENETDKAEDKRSLHDFEEDDFLANLDHHDHHGATIDEPIDSGDERGAVDFIRSCVHPLHTHLLIYVQKYDCKRTLYAMHAFKTMLLSNPRQLIFAMSTTSINSVRTPHLMQLQDLLVRHRGCIFGKNFFGDLNNDAFSTYRNTMYVELMISVCLYYVRSYYTNLMCGLEPHEVVANKEVQIMSSEILTAVLSELVNLLKDSGKTFATYLTDLLNRCKLQKAVLHCLLATVYDCRRHKKSSHVTEAIITFNEMSMDSYTNETFQIKLLRLVLIIIVLEDQLKTQRGDSDPLSSTSTDWERARGLHNAQTQSVKFLHAQPVAYQPMFLTTIMGALKQQHMCHMHRHWIELVVMIMPYVGRALGSLVTSVVDQLCRNIEYLSGLYDTSDGNGRHSGRIPADHILTMLEGMTTLCHYCLLDQSSGISVNRQVVNITESAGSVQLFSNLMNVFTPSGATKESVPNKDHSQPAMASFVSARRGLLSILPRVISSLSSLWRAIHMSEQNQREKDEQPSWTMGYPKHVRQLILEFLSPISVHHNANLLAAFAVVWNDKRRKDGPNLKKYIPATCPDQLLLVDLVSSIRVLPPDTLVQTVKQVMKTPPPTSQDKNKKRTPIEVSMLQFFYAYVQKCSTSQLIDCWPSLLSLIKDGLVSNLTPPGQFLLLLILNEFVQKTPPFEDKKDHRDVQELSQKLLEMCSNVAGSTLEQTTWFRRNLAVKTSLQKDVQKLENGGDESLSRHPPSRIDTITNAQYSVHALLLLAELTAPLLDIVYGSNEKERVVPFLTTSIMYNVFPYLKHHSIDNGPSYRACSQILASLSGYQYTRKAWKKEVFDIFMDSNFFKMTKECIPFWKAIIDNLMTHDKVTFKDLLVRFTSQSTSTLHLFSSREAEYEQRAQLLKKLSYTIFCSETDQYVRYMPDIQEKLSESLKFSQAPVIHAQVFLCFRVLMLRISPHHLTSLWPTIITELVHVFLQLEQELSDGDDMKIQLQRMAAVESNWVFSRPNSQNNPTWLRLYLSACKLLDLALVMPASLLPQFQVYRWAFIGEEDTDAKSRDKQYVPHCLKVAESLNKKYGSDVPRIVRPPGYPMLTIGRARTMADLHPFFATLYDDRTQVSIPIDSESHHQKPSFNRQTSISKSKSAPELSSIQNDFRIESGDSWRDFVEGLIESDFLDPIPSH